MLFGKALISAFWEALLDVKMCIIVDKETSFK